MAGYKFFITVRSVYLGYLVLLKMILKKKFIIYFISLLLFVITTLLFSFLKTTWYSMLFYFNWFNFFNVNYVVYLDSLSIIFVFLTTFLFSISMLYSLRIVTYRTLSYFVILFITELFIVNFFLVSDLFLFFVFFECILLPMYLLIGIWGSNLRKIYASYQLFFFTLFGSIFLLFGILLLYTNYGTTDLIILQIKSFSGFYIDNILSFIICVFFLVSFSVKIPVVPFHFWLPEAHVEAPTIGSVILAGLLLKLGAYGIVRFLIPLYNSIIIYLNPTLITIGVYSIIYISFIIMRQLDLKRIIAYSSILHMNFIFVTLIILSKITILAGIFLLISHGIVSSALFLCIGILYHRFHTRIVLYYKGLFTVMPLFTSFFFFFLMGNASLPGTSNFVGEFLGLVGIFSYNKILLLFFSIGLFFGAIFNFWIYNKMVYGSIRKSKIKKLNDLTELEIYVLLVFSIIMYVMGYFPMSVLTKLKTYVFVLLAI